MIVSTRGRYALRVMIELAEQHNESYVPLRGIVKSQGLSLKYLEAIMTTLVKAGLIQGVHGKGGGYKLAKKPEEYTIADILRVTEKSITPASCSACLGDDCERKGECKTYPFWEKLNSVVDECLNSTTLADLMTK